MDITKEQLDEYVGVQFEEIEDLEKKGDISEGEALKMKTQLFTYEHTVLNGFEMQKQTALLAEMTRSLAALVVLRK